MAQGRSLHKPASVGAEFTTEVPTAVEAVAVPAGTSLPRLSPDERSAGEAEDDLVNFFAQCQDLLTRPTLDGESRRARKESDV